MAIQYFLLDVFADSAFQGTQIPVVIVESPLPTEFKTSIAGEFKQTETVFIEPNNTACPCTVYNAEGPTFFGAHTTLAAAYMAEELNLSTKEAHYSSFTFTDNSRVIHTFIDQSSENHTTVQYSRTLTPTIDICTPDPHRVAEALSFDVKHMQYSKYQPAVVSIEQATLMIPVTKPEHVLAAKLKNDQWSMLLADVYAKNIFLFAPGSITGKTHFHGRLLNPSISAAEFPPIGSVMPEFIAYLCSQKQTPIGTLALSIDRGTPETRKSIIHIEMDNQPKKPITCRIGGKVIKIGNGTLLLDELCVA